MLTYRMEKDVAEREMYATRNQVGVEEKKYEKGCLKVVVLLIKS